MTDAMRTNIVAGAVAVVVMLLGFLVFGGALGNETTSGDASSSEVTVSEITVEVPAASDTNSETQVADDVSAEEQEFETETVRYSDLPTISVDELPIEAVETLLLIEDGGPYPYQQDDGTFQNREGILPDRSDQHYREYTVDTPGSPDRGARRIVTGTDGERYYTSDHYDSFREIVG